MHRSSPSLLTQSTGNHVRVASRPGPPASHGHHSLRPSARGRLRHAVLDLRVRSALGCSSPRA